MPSGPTARLHPPVPPQHLRPRDGGRQRGGAQERAEGQIEPKISSSSTPFSALPLTDIKVQVKGMFRSARAIRAGRAIALTPAYSRFTLPSLKEYELVELQ
jgi:hypothetical protein